MSAMDMLTKSMNHAPPAHLEGQREPAPAATRSGCPRWSSTRSGRKSGQRRTVILTDADPRRLPRRGHRLQGRRRPGHPDWYTNLRGQPRRRDHAWTASPRPMRARTATPEEKAEMWPTVVEGVQGLRRLPARTDRDIPVVDLRAPHSYAGSRPWRHPPAPPPSTTSEATWRSIDELCAELTEEERHRPTGCPGWTVKDNISHLIDYEAGALGRPRPDHTPPALPHVKNPLGEANEVGVDARRSRSGQQVVAELREVAAERLAQLRALTDEDFAQEDRHAGRARHPRRHADPPGHGHLVARAGHPAGSPPAGARVRFLVHEATAYFTRFLPLLVGKRAKAPDGASVVFAVGEGPPVLIAVEGGRAAVVDELAGEPTVELADAGPDAGCPRGRSHRCARRRRRPRRPGPRRGGDRRPGLPALTVAPTDVPTEVLAELRAGVPWAAGDLRGAGVGWAPAGGSARRHSPTCSTVNPEAPDGLRSRRRHRANKPICDAERFGPPDDESRPSSPAGHTVFQNRVGAPMSWAWCSLTAPTGTRSPSFSPRATGCSRRRSSRPSWTDPGPAPHGHRGSGFLRAVNVGKRTVAMARLVEVMDGLGYPRSGPTSTAATSCSTAAAEPVGAAHRCGPGGRVRLRGDHLRADRWPSCARSWPPQPSTSVTATPTS